jgi:PPOX class probable F420-dependent enzyme
MPDGSPQVAPAWVDVEDDEIVINTAEARMEPSNLRNDPRVAIAAVDPDNPHDAVIVRGRVTELSHEGADEQIDALAKRRVGGGEDQYPFSERGEERVTVHVEPEHVSMAGA